MVSHKIILPLAVVAILIAVTQVSSSPQSYYAANNTNKSHNLIVGFRMPGDRLVHRENVQKNSAWMQIVTLEKTFFAPQRERITLIQALDQKTNGNGAYASITNGGPGNTNVTIRFKSQRGHGINFIVELYSRL